MSKANYLTGFCLSECIESGCFHLYTKNAFRTAVVNCRFGFSKRRICCPSCTYEDSRMEVLENTLQPFQQLGVNCTERGWWQIMVARAFIAQCFFDQHKIRRMTFCNDLAC